MQLKGVVRFFLVAMTLVTIVQYLYILPTNRVEKKAEEHAETVAAQFSEEARDSVIKSERIAYLKSRADDEILKMPLMPGMTYQDLKSRQLAFGLDLKGGMSVVLRVDLREFIEVLANEQDRDNPAFQQALQDASERLKNAQDDYITLFSRAYTEKNPDAKLAPLFAQNEVLSDQITFNSSNGEVTRALRQNANETVDRTFKLLKKRIDKLGVVQPTVSLDAARDLILVELPGIDDEERAREFLNATAVLEFWNVYRISDRVNPNQPASPAIIENLIQANTRLTSILDYEENRTIDSIITRYAVDSLTNEIDSTTIAGYDTVYQASVAGGPLLSRLQLNASGGYGQAVMGVAERNQVDSITAYLNNPGIRGLFPRDLSWSWDRDALKDQAGEQTNLYRLYAIRKSTDEAPLTGDYVTSSFPSTDPLTGNVVVSLQMNNTGAQIWGRMTTEAATDNNREIAILLDDEVVSAPSVNGPITGGSSQITGNYSLQDATDFANILEVGKLPAKTETIQEAVVGPSLGQENINRSVRALVIGLLLVLGFMMLYYGGAGIVSIVALFLNLFFIFGALASLNAVLTLPGVAGVILTIGMAVDANVIIFERIREELREGKSTRAAVTDGFKNSYSAIIDANVTTILTAIVLAFFGLGPIKGFAVVLIIGVLSSLFTAVLVGRLIFDQWLSKDRNISFDTGFSRNAFANLKINWLGMRKTAYVISAVLLLASFASFFTRGFELGVDFKGGYSYTIEFDESIDVDVQTLRESLTSSFEGNTPVVKAVDAGNTYNIVTDYLVDATEDRTDDVVNALFAGVDNAVAADLDEDNFKNSDLSSGTHISSSNKVGPTIADDIKTSSFYAAILALLAIFLYIFLRFSKWQFSLGAVAALFHDSIIVLGIFSIFHGWIGFNLEIDQNFIAAILTVIGYSINDTVVVFDRIREYLNTYTRKDKTEVVNMAINSTVSRTVITSLTTLLVVGILFVFGGTSIKGFAFALLIGIVVGTYSSIFVATPIMSDLSKDLKPSKTKKDEGSKGFSKAVKSA
jgi:SecD/SecF fusion protein